MSLPETFTLAVDTEYHDTQTLTVQVAARLNAETLAVQVYRAPAVLDLPFNFDPDAYLRPDRYGQVVVRPVRLLTPDLSPLRMYRDLVGPTDLDILTRKEGTAFRETFGSPGVAVPPNVRPDRRKRRWKVPALTLTIVGHFLSTDFFRLWGRDFLADLRANGIQPRERKLIQLADESKRYGDPVVEYAQSGDRFYEVRVQTRDTIFPYGHASLDALSQTFLGFGKCETLTEQDKQDMAHTFRVRTADAYGYAMADALNTLLVYEQMRARDREIYQAFGFAEEAIPSLRATLGSRVSTFLVRATRKGLGPCEALQSDRALQSLLKQGGMGLFKAHPQASHYGTQTGKVHGGLLYSRSPTKFWHESPGRLRDVDMAGCYQQITSRINVYWGRPVVFEPGNRSMSLKEAIELVRQHAEADGWFIRVSGELAGFANALVPSTDNAITSANYRGKLRHGRRRKERERVFHLAAVRDPGAVKGTGGSRLYASRVESGIVTRATWLMIQALPAAAREQYERLTADSVVFYPRTLVARDGREYDRLFDQYRDEELPWQAELDLGKLELLRRDRIDAAYVSLRFPLGEYARKIGQYRKEAQKQKGKGSGADLSWKVHANAMYGVLGSVYLPTNNFVAGNVITAQARAEAFAMSQALNAIQTITDGCTYRRDQIPACTFAECVRKKPDYPIRRAEDGDSIPFLDPNTIPTDDAAFTAWYRDHVRWFFGVEGAEYIDLFATHSLEHKKTGSTSRVDFDALACDGTSNYLKAVRDDEGRWRGEHFAARSYGPESKRQLQDWVLRTYATDCLTELPPVTEDRELLTFIQAQRKARKALADGMPSVVCPLRAPFQKISAYRVLKDSAYVFETPDQRATILKQIQKFEKWAGAGLEFLTLRRAYGGRRRGSLTDLAEALYAFIRQRRADLTKYLNLNKFNDELTALAEGRRAEISRRKEEAERRLRAWMDARSYEADSLPTAYLIGAA